MDIETLLYEEESASLDFKQKSYKFSGANNHEKSELLKDILAFTNAWRREDAFILLGIKEVKGGRSKPIGITDELDDAQLQEFVNKKTQRPISFTYSTHQIDNVKIGIIKIPLQQRPIYLTNNYGKLKKNAVYIRRGSSTDQASPDEIYRMAKAELEDRVEAPNLSFEFADIEKENLHDDELVISPIILDMARFKEISDFNGNSAKNALEKLQNQSDFMLDPFRETPRKDYYRELAYFSYIHNKTKKFSFAITNKSSVSVTDINVQIYIDKNKNLYSLFEATKLPESPKSYERSGIIFPIKASDLGHNFVGMNNDFYLEEIGNQYRINLTFNKLKPKQTIYCSEDVCISALDSFDLKAKVIIYADNLQQPLNKDLRIICQAEKRTHKFDGLTEKGESGFVLKIKKKD